MKKVEVKKMTVEIPVALHQKAKLYAVKTGTSLQALVIKGLEQQIGGGR